MQKEQFEAIIDNMSDGLLIVDINNKIIRSNSRAREFIECCDHEDNLLQSGNFPVNRVLKGERIKDYQFTYHKSDRKFHFSLSASPIYDSEGNFIAGVLISRDIGDRLKDEENFLIKTQYNLLNNIIENLEVGFARCSYPDYKIIDINNKAYNDLKQINPKINSVSSVKKQNFFEICNYNSDEKFALAESIQNLAEKGKASFNNIRKYVLSGEERYFRIICQPLFGLNNQVIEIIIISIDITDEVQSKNKMEEALKVQEETFANVSHELKTPLNVIFSTDQLMELYLKNNSLETNKEKISKSINIIKQNCYRFTKLINNIIDISKIDSGFFKVNLSNENIVDVTEEIVQSVSEYIKRKDISIVFDTNTEEKIIACDPNKIERIILNLISNAIKFTNPGGSITVTVFDKGESVEISVRDTGIGMDENCLDNIFKRFHQIDKSLSRNSEGSGIGLSLVKSIVELHGGKISVKSKPDEGSTFIIELPANTIENPKAAAKAKSMNDKVETINIEFSDIYSI